MFQIKIGIFIQLVNATQNVNYLSLNKRAFDMVQNTDVILPFATCVLWGKDHFRTFQDTFYRFPGK